MTGWRKRQIGEHMTKDEALKQWADDVSKAYDILAFGHTERAVEILAKTRNAMREALAQPAQEPVAWVEYETGNNTKRPQNCGTGYCSCIECVMEPAQRTWVGLTDEEIDDLHMAVKVRLMGTFDTKDIYRAVEAKLKEKNDG